MVSFKFCLPTGLKLDLGHYLFSWACHNGWQLVMINKYLLNDQTGSGQPEMTQLLPLGPRGGPPKGGKVGQESLCRAPMGLSVERGLTLGLGSCAKCPSVFMLLGDSWVCVRLTLPTISFPADEGCCQVKCSTWHSSLVPHAGSTG